MPRRILVALATAALIVMALAGTALAAPDVRPAAGELAAAPTPTATGKPWLGITVVNVNEKMAERFKIGEGVAVVQVAPDGPAAAAGVKFGDIVTAINGVPVKTVKDVTTELQKVKVGDAAILSINRKGESLSITVKAEAAPIRALSAAERFANNYGSTHTYKDKDGNVKTRYSIPGTVTAISATSITITPNNPQSRGGPFSVDGNTRIMIGQRRGTAENIKVGDKVIVVVVGDSSHADAITKVQLANAPRQLQSPARLLEFLRRNLPRMQQRTAPGIGTSI